MFFSFKYLVFIVTFNHCCGSSNLIPTAVYSRPLLPANNRQRFSAGPVKTTFAHYYPIYAVGPNLPLGSIPSFGELQYSASFTQPNAQLPNGNIKNLEQKKRKPVSVQRVTAQVKTVETPNAKYMPIRINQRPNLSSKVKSVQTQVDAMLTTNQNSSLPILLKAQISGTFTTLPPNSFQFSTISRPLTRRQKPEMNSTFARVQSIRFNWPKSEQQIQQNYSTKDSQNQQTIHKEVSSLQSQIQSQIQLRPHLQLESQPQPQEWTSSHSNQNTKKQKFRENQQYFRYDLTKRTESTQMPTFETEIFRETTPMPTTMEPTTVIFKKEIIDSFKRENLSLADSEINFQTQYYDSEKISNHNYDQNEQINEQVNSYGSPINVDNELSLPENEAINYDNYGNPEPEPVLHTDNYEDNNKELTDGSIESSGGVRSGPELKSLLEHFIQQLDLLKFVASKELYKANDYSQNYRSKSDDETIQQTLTEPLGSKSGSTYNDYQNERSFEQIISNDESKIYRDTHENNGRYGEKNYYFPNDSYDYVIPNINFDNELPELYNPPHIHYNTPSQTSNSRPNFNTNNPKPLLLSTADSELNFKTKNKNTFQPIVSDITLSVDTSID